MADERYSPVEQWRAEAETNRQAWLKSEAERARLQEENEQWTKWGIVEIAVRNPNVSSYVEHWEGRALKAEAAIVRLEEGLRAYGQHRYDCQVQNTHDAPKCDCGFDTLLRPAQTAEEPEKDE